MPERPPAAPAAAIPAAGGRSRPGIRAWWAVAGIFCAVLVVYFPALRGGLVWDDDGHVTRAALRSWGGLWRIWFEVGATQQYYPLLHSAFWAEHRLWGDATAGYHLTNILLHAGSACLLALILRRLAVPGAWLAAFIFAVHPVCVESVAWIAEQKNTLSTAFYLGAALAYLRFDDERKPRQYLAAFFLFVCGLLTKTVTATLPAALLVVFWWRRGRLSWRRDVLPLVPWFVCGAAGGLFTAWVERHLIGAEGAPFELTPLQRTLLAGRVIWFYAGKLFWPARLAFIYPRWNIDPSAARQWLPLAGVLALGACLWLMRRWSRAPLAAFLFFGGSLFPVLGFFNVFPFMYSFVADHFQYLPGLGVIALTSAGLTNLVSRAAVRATGPALAALLLAALGALAWQQSGFYRDGRTLYRAAITRNPDCWLAYNNLGSDLLDNDGKIDDAISDFKQALRSKPDYAEAHYNYGRALARLGRWPDAIEQYHQALDSRPRRADVYDSLGIALFQEGRMADAMEQYREALRIDPMYSQAHYNLGSALVQAGRLPEAIEQYQEAVRLAPGNAEVENLLGVALIRAGRPAEAAGDLEQAVQLKPGDAGMHTNLGIALAGMGRLPQALAQYGEALRLKPDYPEAYLNLGNALFGLRRLPEAIGSYEQALRLKPDYAEVHYNLGMVLAQSGRLPEAAEHFEEVLRIDPNDAQAREILARLQAYQSKPAPEK